MAKYDVFVFCDECGDVHPMGIRIDLNDGPADKKSIGDHYAGKGLPSSILTMISNYINCPKTNKMIRQENNDQVFLVPVA